MKKKTKSGKQKETIKYAPKSKNVVDLSESDDELTNFENDEDDADSVDLSDASSDSENLRNEVEDIVKKFGLQKKRKASENSDDDSLQFAKKPKQADSSFECIKQPKAKTVTQPNAKVVKQPNAKTVKQPNAVTQPNDKTVTQHNAKTVTQPNAKTVTQPNAKTVTQLNVKTVAQASTKTGTQIKEKTVAQKNTKNNDVPTTAQTKEKKTLQLAVKNFSLEHKSRKYLLVKAGPWSTNQFSDDQLSTDSLPKDVIDQLEEFAKKLLAEEVALYRLQQDRKSSTAWMKKVLTSGTSADKMSALVVLIQDSPVHNLQSIDSLISMMKMKERRKTLTVLDAVKQLFLKDLLFGRKLRPFRLQPLNQVEQLSNGDKDVRDRRLLVWYFESQLQLKYEEFIKSIEILSRDTVEQVKSKAIGAIFDMLCEQPEQEKVLLSMLVNKLGDPVRKMAAKTAHLLSKLVEKHPNMKTVVTLEVERLLYRTNVTPKAQYYSICFLNQIRLGKRDSELASRLVAIYFSYFKAFISKGDIDLKIMSALLHGVKTAFDFATVERQKIAEQSETLFRLVHISNFNTSIQALALLFQIMDVSDSSTDRFYMALYRKMLDPELASSSKLPIVLNLLLKSMKKDLVEARIQAFIKRLLQISMCFTPPLVCSALLVLSKVLEGRKQLLVLNKVPQEYDDDEEEHFVDVKEEIDAEDVTDAAAAQSNSKSKIEVVPSWVHRENLSYKKEKYDPLHRNPLYCRADKDCMWELQNFIHHYHPSVRNFATKIIQGESIDYTSNPLEDFSYVRFLDRLIRRNPKKTVEDTTDKDNLSSDDDVDIYDGGADIDGNDIDDFEDIREHFKSYDGISNDTDDEDDTDEDEDDIDEDEDDIDEDEDDIDEDGFNEDDIEDEEDLDDAGDISGDENSFNMDDDDDDDDDDDN